LAKESARLKDAHEAHGMNSIVFKVYSAQRGGNQLDTESYKTSSSNLITF